MKNPFLPEAVVQRVDLELPSEDFHAFKKSNKSLSPNSELYLSSQFVTSVSQA